MMEHIPCPFLSGPMREAFHDDQEPPFRLTASSVHGRL